LDDNLTEESCALDTVLVGFCDDNLIRPLAEIVGLLPWPRIKQFEAAKSHKLTQLMRDVLKNWMNCKTLGKSSEMCVSVSAEDPLNAADNLSLDKLSPSIGGTTTVKLESKTRQKRYQLPQQVQNSFVVELTLTLDESVKPF